jgi:serine phosphatase RsbU (regulator of sigma subunit)
MRLILNSLEESYREIEKNNSIMESIRYAKRIQDAFLPSCEQRKKIFPDSFVIYKPLHTVSGDFYWVSEHENLKIACIVDCTGHGIPAAFLSLLANSLLTEAIIHNKIFSPTLVIAWLHRGIQQRLQSGDDKLKDGMDLGICVIEYLNKQEVKIVYEGTKHILFVTRNGKVARYNSSRLNLGYSEKFFRVEDKEFLLQRNDMLYLTTDGYIDQADAKRQRFGSAKFTQLIAENHDKTITEQKSIFEETLGEHSNNAIQRDDITVFGIQL